MFPGIRQLQLILLKVALLLGVEVHTGVEFQGLMEPTGENGIYIQPSANPFVSPSVSSPVVCMQNVKHIKVWRVPDRLDGEAASPVSSCGNLPV